ncbi:enoyl-CoA hydratase-related protein [Pseudooceanicola sp.]|uniref:enoyl-CoA hydratase-related protein n=1 Tax=Pseudooceanicola sp. TaxID=1914328 RepID=UPI0035C7096B
MTFEVVDSGASRIAIIRIVNPPVNAVSLPMRRLILSSLDDIAADAQVQGVVLCGAGRLFASGIPLDEVEAGIERPALGEVCQHIEMMSKPVVALLEGHVAAAGLEIALSAHARVATQGAKLGLPDFRLGLSPGGGATQRLPRLIGAGAALEMLLEAQPHAATSQLCQPLIDRISTGPSPLDEAVLLAAELVEGGGWTRTRDRVDGLLDPMTFQAQIRARRAQLRMPGDELPARIIEAVEAAQLLPFEAGLALEAQCFDDLRASPRSQGLRRSRHSEQRANRLTDLSGPDVTRIAVLGPSASMLRVGGAGVLGNLGVTLFDPDGDRVAQVREDLLTKVRPMLASKGAARVAAAEEALLATSDPEALGRAQLVLVMGLGQGETLRATLREMAPHLTEEAAVLCQSEQSDLGASVPAELKDRVFALAMTDRDFPARAAEVSVTAGAAAPVLALVQAGLWKLNRMVVRGQAGRAMMIPTLFDTMMAAADGLVRCSISPGRIERALLDHGFARSPYALLMQADGAAYLARTMNRRLRMGLSHRVVTESIAPVVDGKTSVMLDYVAADMIETAALPLSDTEIAGAMTAALANTGCRLIAEGAAVRPMQIDAVMLHGFGYPRRHGGPMAEADLTGLRSVLELCKAFVPIDAELWRPHPMLQEFFVNGLQFRDLDHRDADVRAA